MVTVSPGDARKGYGKLEEPSGTWASLLNIPVVNRVSYPAFGTENGTSF
jgi:hypothetical protein